MGALRWAEATFALVVTLGAILLLVVWAAVETRHRAMRAAQADCAQRCVVEAPADTDVSATLDGWSCVCLTDAQAWRLGSPHGWVAPSSGARTPR